MVSRRGITQRDLGVLVFAAEQFALPMPLCAELVRRGAGVPLAAAAAATVARRTAGRLEELRLARRVRIVGEVWLVPTKRGLAMAADGEEARPFEVWHPRSLVTLVHTATVSRLRLHLADAHPEASWESERAIRRRLVAADARAGQKLGYRVADGGLWWPDGQAVGVECELTMKKPGEYAELVSDTDTGWSKVWWFTRPGHVELLQRRLHLGVGGDRHQVFVLPEGVGR